MTYDAPKTPVEDIVPGDWIVLWYGDGYQLLLCVSTRRVGERSSTCELTTFFGGTGVLAIKYPLNWRLPCINVELHPW